ncbi:hypothetical protein KK137_10990 [Croceibacterium sp. LX-88]|uniref:Uncharacterized protein n=1 Tax=Croceibacterium selenioxidans TaxID=2838833 RepID=A0ABS5W8Y3_9SPHN|nr:hypothetical protein [Croceibacterium selenioxidans]MBT2134859.1 hypothetical protein [Croceibacterium selenioxidans]
MIHRSADTGGRTRGVGLGQFLGDFGSLGLRLRRLAGASGKQEQASRSGHQPHASGVHDS